MSYGLNNVIVVDDDDDCRENLVEILEREGFSVSQARNGFEALEAIHRCQDRCVVVLDLVMPEMDGFEFLQEQLKLPGAGSGRPVIVVSGMVDARAAAKLPSVVAVLQKPFELSDFVAMVREHATPIGRNAEGAPESPPKRPR